MRILHISPTFFSSQSVIGGGERYPLELAKAMARNEDVVLLSFSEQAASESIANLRTEYLVLRRLLKDDPLSYLPLNTAFFKWIYWADIVHCHQPHTHVASAALILGKLLNKRLFVTDLGGGTRYAPSYYLPVLNCADGLLLLSEYSNRLWQQAKPKFGAHHFKHVKVIYGGVDTAKFSPGIGDRSKSALFVGRLLPHKGVEYLIEAIQDDLSLDVVGRPYSEEYFSLLQEKSIGGKVNFFLSADDDEVIEKYRRSLVTVVPSVYRSSSGDSTLVPELLGLVALESMACGTPVIASSVASLPELVEDGVTGFLVPPNDPIAIREKIVYLRDNPGVAEEMGRRCREQVVKSFTWDAVASRCLESYQAV